MQEHVPPGRIAIGAYAFLGVVLVASRVVGLNQSFWTDEIIAVRDFVREGPRVILAGPDLSHELYGILAWVTSSAVGESETALRLLSVVPFLVGVALATAWLQSRWGSVAGVGFLFFATTSPLLLDITRQARGYGLAFLAMCVLVVAALEAERSARTGWIAAFCVAGFVGTATLPQFGIAFVATGATLVAITAVRRRAIAGLLFALAAIAVWYAPHAGEVNAASQIEDGARIETAWLLTAPIDQVLLPGLIWIDGTVLVPGVVWIPAVLLAIAVVGYSPLVRRLPTAFILLSGPIATVVVLWLAEAYVIPRYLSYLLVPLFVAAATGLTAITSRGLSGATVVPAVVVVVLAAALGLRFVVLAPDVMRFPREANRDAARAVLGADPPPARVLAYMRNPRNLEHYLGREVESLDVNDVVERVCGGPVTLAYVTQPFTLATVDVPCLARDGVVHHRFEQYARGGEMNVWIVPPG